MNYTYWARYIRYRFTKVTNVESVQTQESFEKLFTKKLCVDELKISSSDTYVITTICHHNFLLKLKTAFIGYNSRYNNLIELVIILT